MKSENKYQRSTSKNLPSTTRTGTKAQQGDGVEQWQLSRLQQAVGRQIPGVPVASANLDPGLKGRVELDAGIKETQGETSRALSAFWAKIIAPSLWWEWTHRARFKTTMSSELVGFLYSIPQTHQARPSIPNHSVSSYRARDIKG